MIKRTKLKKVVIGIVLVVMLISSVSVFASGAIKKQLEVTYNDIKLVVDGKPVEFGNDSAGNKIEPFIYNGTTYLPVRSVGEAVDKKIAWDSTTQTVYLGKRPGEVSYMTETIKPYSSYISTIYELNDSNILKMGGKDYKTGYIMKGLSESYMIFNLDGLYTEINGMLGATSWENLVERDVNIYLDGNLYKTIVVDPNELPKEISIPVKGVMQLKVESNSRNHGQYTYIGFGDLIIK